MTNIDRDYRAQIQAMHAGGKFNNGAKQFGLVQPFLEQYHPTSLLDFGCGKGALIAEISAQYPGIACSGYDPGNPLFDHWPDRTFDAVISTDALEHIEPDYLDQTLRDMFARMERCGFFRIACHPAKKHLPDGRNCHLIVEEPEWWRKHVLAASSADIVWERIEPFDKSDKWPAVKGSKYDIIVVKK